MSEQAVQDVKPAAPPLTWEASKTRYAGGETLRLGKYPVGEWQLDATIPKGTKASYAVTCRLPGVRAELGHCESSANARALLEKVVTGWVNSAGLSFTTPDSQPSGVLA